MKGLKSLHAYQSMSRSAVAQVWYYFDLQVEKQPINVIHVRVRGHSSLFNPSPQVRKQGKPSVHLMPCRA